MRSPRTIALNQIETLRRPASNGGTDKHGACRSRVRRPTVNEFSTHDAGPYYWSQILTSKFAMEHLRTISRGTMQDGGLLSLVSSNYKTSRQHLSIN
jgi:hypothetical protein